MKATAQAAEPQGTAGESSSSQDQSGPTKRLLRKSVGTGAAQSPPDRSTELPGSSLQMLVFGGAVGQRLNNVFTRFRLGTRNPTSVRRSAADEPRRETGARSSDGTITRGRSSLLTSCLVSGS